MTAQRCVDREHLHTLDDCGSMYCDLLDQEWTDETWGGCDDYCDECPFAAESLDHVDEMGGAEYCALEAEGYFEDYEED